MPPTQDLGQTVSSVNFYCTIILDYLVVRDINIITVKLKCLHPMFSLVILVRGVGGKLSRLVYLAPCPEFGSGSVISQFLLHHNLYLGQNEMFTSNVQFDYPCPRGGGQAVQAALSCPPPPPIYDFCQTLSSVNSYCTIILEYLGGGKLSRLVYLAPRLGFGSGSVISQFLLHHNLGIFSCKRYKHYFSQTEMFTSNIQFGYSCPRGGGQAVQVGLSCPPPRI